MGYAGGEINKTHLRFEKMPLQKGNKLHTYKVINTTFEEKIGVIHWRSGWRQYVFRADLEVDMSVGCNEEVNIFIRQLMKDWRKKCATKGIKAK